MIGFCKTHAYTKYHSYTTRNIANIAAAFPSHNHSYAHIYIYIYALSCWCIYIICLLNFHSYYHIVREYIYKLIAIIIMHVLFSCVALQFIFYPKILTILFYLMIMIFFTKIWHTHTHAIFYRSFEHSLSIRKMFIILFGWRTDIILNNWRLAPSPLKFGLNTKVTWSKSIFQPNKT